MSWTIAAAGLISFTTLHDSPAHIGAYSGSPSKWGVTNGIPARSPLSEGQPAAAGPSGTKTGSWRPHVLVDEPAEEISPFDVGHALGLF
jgi:hypothetical protein